MLSESQGCEVLKAIFEARGFRIAEDFPFREGKVAFNVDGWDPEARVGYEYMTHSARDHADLEPDELLLISEWNERGRLFIFIVDETEVNSAEELSAAANAFLDEVDARRAG